MTDRLGPTVRAVGTACALLAVPVAAAGQATPPASVDDLLRAESRIREGRIAEARREVARWWLVSGGEATPEVLPFALWLRGILTVDPVQADLDFRRIVVEYPSGPYAGPARLRLGQSAHARGDLPAALRHYRALDRDHPRSRFRLIARAWLDRYEAAAEAAVGDTLRGAVRSPRTNRKRPHASGATQP